MGYQINQTEIFRTWHFALRDLRARLAISRRIDIAEAGSLGNVRSVGDGVSEMKIDVGPGYRLYFTIRGRTVIFLLCGGDKSTQDADIRRAKDMAKEV
jgi:putative addiction module killer protein